MKAKPVLIFEEFEPFGGYVRYYSDMTYKLTKFPKRTKSYFMVSDGFLLYKSRKSNTWSKDHSSSELAAILTEKLMEFYLMGSLE